MCIVSLVAECEPAERVEKQPQMAKVVEELVWKKPSESKAWQGSIFVRSTS